MRSEQSIFLAGCEKKACEFLCNALEHAGFHVTRSELDDDLSADVQPDCVVFYLTSDNGSRMSELLACPSLSNSQRIAILDLRDNAVCAFVDRLSIDETIYKPVHLNKLIAAIDRVLGNTEIPSDSQDLDDVDIPDNGDFGDDSMDMDDDAADKAQQAWAIAQYQKRHGQELPPDEWKQMMLTRLKEDSATKNKRTMRILGIAILLISLAIAAMILFKMNRVMNAQIDEQLIHRHHK